MRFAHRAGRCGAAVLLALAALVAFASQPAAAHQPVILDENDNSPEQGPELVDGTVSFAVYGSITKPGDLRGLTFNLKAGDPIVVDLLIPNLEPELSSPLPTITVLDPDGNPTDPPVAMGEVFNESFSRTSYRYLAKLRSSATKAGRYGVVVGSPTTGRFVIGIGDREVRGEVKQDDAKGSLASWYATSVPTVTGISPPTTAPPLPSETTATAAPSNDRHNGSSDHADRGWGLPTTAVRNVDHPRPDQNSFRIGAGESDVRQRTQTVADLVPHCCTHLPGFCGTTTTPRRRQLRVAQRCRNDLVRGEQVKADLRR
jgi:hypothetical protein